MVVGKHISVLAGCGQIIDDSHHVPSSADALGEIDPRCSNWFDRCS